MSASELTVERLLRAHAPHAPETLRTRVLALESAPQRRNTPSRRLVLVALPAAIAIAVLAAVVLVPDTGRRRYWRNRRFVRSRPRRLQAASDGSKLRRTGPTPAHGRIASG